MASVLDFMVLHYVFLTLFDVALIIHGCKEREKAGSLAKMRLLFPGTIESPSPGPTGMTGNFDSSSK